MQRYRQRTLKITREEVGVIEGSQALPRSPAPPPPPSSNKSQKTQLESLPLFQPHLPFLCFKDLDLRGELGFWNGRYHSFGERVTIRGSREPREGKKICLQNLHSKYLTPEDGKTSSVFPAHLFQYSYSHHCFSRWDLQSLHSTMFSCLFSPHALASLFMQLKFHHTSLESILLCSYTLSISPPIVLVWQNTNSKSLSAAPYLHLGS